MVDLSLFLKTTPAAARCALVSVFSWHTFLERNHIHIHNQTPVLSRGCLLQRVRRTDGQWSKIWLNGSEPTYYFFVILPSVLWRCWLGGRKGIRPVKNWVVRCWHGYLSGVRCRLACAQLMPLPLTVSCFSKIQIGFTFLVPAHLGSPRHRAVKGVCVCYFGSTF